MLKRDREKGISSHNTAQSFGWFGFNYIYKLSGCEFESLVTLVLVKKPCKRLPFFFPPIQIASNTRVSFLKQPIADKMI